MSAPPTPRVSILIPNFNNGRQSARDGQTDLLGDLLRSLQHTLADDPTPTEIIAYDDGSTDDSRQTLRDYAGHTGKDGQPFLELIEAEHCGVLAKTANVMSRRARGDILVRLDGDTVMLTKNWAQKLCAVFDHGPPNLGVVGPKQLRIDGYIHAFGDWILHPGGYHHIAAGLPRDAVQWPLECDHVMGCFYCCKKEVFDTLGGYDEALLRGQTIDFGLRARYHGYTCIAVPYIEFVHRHGARVARQTKADTDGGVKHTLATFEEKWGFNRIAPDLDVVRQRYRGTPLLWNARWFAIDDTEAHAHDGASAPALQIKQTDWHKYQHDTSFQNHVARRVQATLHLLKQVPSSDAPPRIVQVGSDCGLIAHLLANQGAPVTGVERNKAKHELAQHCIKDREYPKGAPTFVHQPDRRTLPLADDAADLLLLLDRLEVEENPVGLLREVRRVLRPGGLIAILGARQRDGDDAATDPAHRYTWGQLSNQLNLAAGAQVLNTDHDPNGPDVFVIAATPASAPAEDAPAADAVATGQAAG